MRLFQFFLILSLLYPLVAESKLDQFEKQVTTKKKKTDDKKSDVSEKVNRAVRVLGSEASSTLFELMLDGFKYRKELKDHQPKEHKIDLTPTEPRKPSSRITRLSAYYSFQSVDGDIHSHQYGFYLGYRELAIAHDTANYIEDNPQDSLRYTNTSVLLRFIATDKFMWSIGPGLSNLKGNDSHWSLSATNYASLYVKGNAYDGVSINLNSSFYWLSSNTLNKNDLSLAYSTRFISVHGGYQWHYAENTTFELNGPYLGASVHF